MLDCDWLFLQPPSTNKILITPELWLQENAQSGPVDAAGDKTTGHKRELTPSENSPLDLNIKVCVYRTKIKITCISACLSQILHEHETVRSILLSIDLE